MSDSDMSRLEFCEQMINVMDLVVSRHNGIEQAVEDLEGQNALYMCLLQIGETLPKIKNDAARNIFPISQIKSLRNIITHEYSKIDHSIMEEILEFQLPELKNQITIAKRILNQ